jgi:hypothetical protein
MYALHVVHGVVAYGVSAASHFFKQFRVTTHVVSDHEERGFHVVFVKYVEHLWCDFGHRTVIEREVHGLTVAAFYAPQRFGKEQSVS